MLREKRAVLDELSINVASDTPADPMRNVPVADRHYRSAPRDCPPDVIKSLHLYFSMFSGAPEKLYEQMRSAECLADLYGAIWAMLSPDPVWQTIDDSTPRDGRLIRLAFGSWSPPSVGWYSPDGSTYPWLFIDQQTEPASHFVNRAVEHLPTHWAPLGDAPKAQS